MNKQELLRALPVEILRHDFDPFADEPPQWREVVGVWLCRDVRRARREVG